MVGAGANGNGESGAGGAGDECDVRNDEQFGEEIAVPRKKDKGRVVAGGSERDGGVERLAEMAGGAEGLDGFGDLRARAE